MNATKILNRANLLCLRSTPMPSDRGELTDVENCTRGQTRVCPSDDINRNGHFIRTKQN